VVWPVELIWPIEFVISPIDIKAVESTFRIILFLFLDFLVVFDSEMVDVGLIMIIFSYNNLIN
jgi:hypothetical protein